MVTQILYGEHYKVLKTQDKWIQIELAFDDYKGWIDKRQHWEIGGKSYEQLNKKVSIVSSDLVAPVNCPDHIAFPVLIGSNLPKIPELKCEYDGNTTNVAKINKSRSNLIENAFMYLNAPYLWGGRSPFGIDCSGFTQMVYKMNGFKLPRDAWQQAEVGDSLSFIEEAEEGDLAFFDNDDGKIIHVGIMLTNNQIIHASGKVRIDRIDHQGIFNQETNDYSHHLRLIKKVIQ